MSFKASEVDNSAADGDGDGLRAAVGAQFLHDVFDVNLDGFLRDEELLGDISIAMPPAMRCRTSVSR